MKKWVKIILVILPILISSGLTIYYFYEISKPWYVFEKADGLTGTFDRSLLLKNGNNVFVATNQKELDIYHLSENNSISFHSNVKFNVPLNQKIAIEENFLYTANNNLFYIYNFTNFTNYGQVGKINISTYIYDFEIKGEIVYLVSSFNLYILNITNPSNITIVSRYNENGHFAYGKHTIAYYDGFLYLTDTIRGLRIINVTDPTNPVQVSQYIDYMIVYGTKYAASEVSVSEKYVALLDGNQGLIVYQRITPEHLLFLGHTYVSSSTVKMEIKGNFIYIAEKNQGFRLVSIADPSEPYTETLICNNSICYDFILLDQDALVLQEDEIGYYQLFLGVGPNPTRKAIAIDVITGFLQVLAYLVLAVVLFILVKRSRILQ
ncbi:LVIVD repeat-containing protein [Candidatus Harpocratesius sp.]